LDGFVVEYGQSAGHSGIEKVDIGIDRIVM
jgi:hypothetical protein